MRVVYFSQDYTPHDHRFLAALAGTEHDVHFLQLENNGTRLERRSVPGGVQVIDWWGGRRPVARTEFLEAAREVRKVLHALKPEVIHAGPVQGPALLAAMAGFHPLLTMSWGSDLLRDAQKGWGRNAAIYTLRRSDAFAADCDAVRDRAVELGMQPERIVVFPWGVDLRHFSPNGEDRRRALGWEREFVLLSARAWEPLYGVDVIVEAFVQASQARSDLRLLMLGDGSLGPRLKTLIEEAGLNDRVHFAGRAGFESLPGLYRTADLYVSASWSDGSSISLLEALACGRPALASDIPGNREWVDPGTNGRLFPAGDPVELAAGILHAASGEDDLDAMGARSRAIAEGRADWTRNFPRLLEGYELARSGRGN